jgi:hypothetical protein
VLRELYLRKYKCKRSQKKIERYRKEIDKLTKDYSGLGENLDMSIETTARKDLNNIDIARSK